MFAYNHNKYEELCCTAIMDTLTLPADLIKKFLSGGWTVRVRGRPFHNLALDEAHESVINLRLKRLKTITSRPSHFRTVELSNFMSYLDKVVRGFESLVYRNKQTEPVQQRKIARGYADVWAVIPWVWRMVIVFLAMLVSSCSLLLPSLVVDALWVKVASSEVFFFVYVDL